MDERTAVERKPAKSFRDLLVWRKAHAFTLGMYGFTAGFPKQETYALSIQMRRAAVSIPANIAEGFRKRGKADKARFMNTAEGSIEERRYYLILAQDLGYGQTETLMTLLEEVSRLLNAYARAILASDF
ncbi:MAG: four helix bundle protein [Acidobacteria bacterium]|nr:MAG: four helix bundle protein [Acidobacteriota bacterium]